MWLSDTSVKRPVIAIVLSLLLCIFGAVSFSKLAIREMPDVDDPVVTVRTSYKGASAAIMESQITSVIEERINGISGIDKITSITRNGISRVTVTFNLGWDLTQGVSDIRDAVSKAQSSLPEQANDPVVSKDNGSGEPSLYLNLNSTNMDRTQLTDYAKRVLEDRFSLISGVSSISISGGLYQVMYLKLDPDLMAGRGVTVNDIRGALKKENIEAPAGVVRNDATVMSVRTARVYNDPEDFNYLIVRTTTDGQPIYLKDVAKVYIGAENENSSFKSDGIMNLSLGVITQSDANPLKVASAVRLELSNIQKFLPSGASLTLDYDSTVFIENSISEVYKTLFITAGLVILVLYLFIGQVRATIIPAVTVPVSLISSFIGAYYLGYSINLITLMALILSIGLVVDDAIVVVENIFHHIEKGEKPLVAAYKGTREVSFAVVATTLVLVMVFLPISFMDGMVGLLFTEFSVLLSLSVIFSSLIALTLTPVLGSKILKFNVKPNRFNIKMDLLFARLEYGYRELLIKGIKLKNFAPFIIIACIGGSFFLMKLVPSQFAPAEDRGVIFAFIKGAEATSYNRMTANMDIVEERLLPLVGKGVIKSFSTQAPAFGGNAGDQTGFVIMILEDWKDRSMSSQKAVAMVNNALKDIPDVKIRSMIPGFRGGSNDPVQFVLAGADYKTLYKAAELLRDESEKGGFLIDGTLDYFEKTPELVVSIDKERAGELGISVDDISTTLEVMLGGRKETTYVDRGEEYDVYLRGDENRFNNASDLSRIYIRTNKGSLITLDAVTSIEEQASAQRLSHNNKQKAITLRGDVPSGYTLGETLELLDAKAIELLSSDISIDYKGESKDYKENQSSIFLTFSLALLVAYLVLAAQFESFINPLVVILTVPMGIFGGFLGLFLMGQGLNIYSQIGMIMLIGMVTKNGILIVEFANQLRDRGVTFEKAIIDASTRRLRPILMTAFTTVIGSAPLIFATGAGSESRIAVGTVVFFGMAFATIVTLFVIPAMYRLISHITHSPGYIEAQLEEELNKELQNKI